MTDKREFETIFRRHYDEMFRLARKMLGDDAESKDVVSDVFAHLLSSSKNLRADTLQNYLLTSVRNRCINLLVKKQRTQAVVVDLNVENTDGGLLDDMYHYIDGQLPTLSQQVLRLRYLQGLKYREIAETLQVSEVTVHNHLSQSLKQLKDHFKSLGYGIK
jgi:RNA polymerase sigma-70 factor (ECF subfamily)